MLGKYFAHSDASPEVRAEQIRAVAGHLPIVASGTLIAAGVVYFLLHDIVRHEHLLGWCGGIVVLLVARLLYYRSFRRRVDDLDAVLSSEKAFILMALVSGSLWALLPPLFIQGDNAFILISITIILIGMTAGSLASESVFMPVFLAYSLPVMLSLSTSIFILGDSYDYLGLLGYAFFAEIIGFAVRSGRTQQKSFELRFERIALLEDLEAQKREAEQANLAKSRFLAAASHDLRQPLHALGLYLESLKLELTTERQQQLAHKIAGANDVLGELFQCLLDISRLDAGIIEPTFKNFALADLLQRMSDQFTPQAELKGLSLELEHHNEIVSSDPLLLERILDNLISNAVRYTESGKIRVATRASDEGLEILVEDSGIGIPAAEHACIFDEFHQLDNSARDRSKGLGLGLAIVKRLCHLLQYRIELESATGRGSRFRLLMPSAVAQSIVDTPETPMFDVRAPARARILVVDDDAVVREAMQDLLCGWGHDVLCAASLDAALTALDNAFLPELLLLDYRLADGVTGVDAAAAIIARLERRPPVILITGDTAPERFQEARRQGYALLYKPVNPAQLRMAINQKIASPEVPARVAQPS